MSDTDISGDQSGVFGTEEINLVGHDDVGGAKTKRWRWEGKDEFGEATPGQRYWTSDTGLENKVSKSDFRASRCRYFEYRY